MHCWNSKWSCLQQYQWTSLIYRFPGEIICGYHLHRHVLVITFPTKWRRRVKERRWWRKFVRKSRESKEWEKIRRGEVQRYISTPLFGSNRTHSVWSKTQTQFQLLYSSGVTQGPRITIFVISVQTLVRRSSSHSDYSDANCLTSVIHYRGPPWANSPSEAVFILSIQFSIYLNLSSTGVNERLWLPRRMGSIIVIYSCECRLRRRDMWHGNGNVEDNDAAIAYDVLELTRCGVLLRAR